MSLNYYNVAARRRRVGLTLLELVVVLSVLALLAAMVIPKIADLVDRSRSSTQSYSTADVGRQIEIYYGMNRKYSDGWDTLLASSGSALYGKLNTLLTSSVTTTTGGTGSTSGPILTTATLSAEQLKSLSSAGIGHGFLHDSTSAPSYSGTDRRHFGDPGETSHDGTTNVNTLAVINESTGSRGLSILVNDFGLNPNKSSTDTTLTRINANVYVAFGLGPKSTLVQTQILEAPILENASSSTTYSRAIVVFEVPNAPSVAGSVLTPAKLVGIIGPDGRTKAMSASDFTNINGVQPH